MLAKIRSRQVTAAMFMVLFAACNVNAQNPGSTGTSQAAVKMNTEVPADTVIADQNWVIFPEHKVEEMGIASWLLKSDDLWTPPADEILKLEEKLPQYLSQNTMVFYHQPPVWERLDGYQRQYIGFESDGKQMIYANYFCDSLGKNWREDLVMVEDGGDCYFQFEYDVKSGLFSNLLVNGES
jgi:hypothetical protein